MTVSPQRIDFYAFFRMPAFAVALIAFAAAPALAADKPPLAPDAPAPFATPSRISFGIEFGLPFLARQIERDVPRGLATFDERVTCVHRRVLFFRVNANCDIRGYIERTGPISLRGEGTRIIGSTPIYGTVEGQGANRFTRRIHGDTEARMIVEGEARPELRRDWSVDMHFSDGFHWTQPPYLHVLGREIPLARYVEPRIRAQLGRVRARALAAARKLNLRGKAETAWASAFTPIQLVQDPPVWLQLKPETAAFSGTYATPKVLRGTLQIDGTAETLVGATPPAIKASALPPLGSEVTAPGTFDVVLPVRIDYARMKQAIQELATSFALDSVSRLRDVDVYPSSGKLVIGLKIAKAGETDADAGTWYYLAAKPQIDTVAKTIRLAELVASDPSSDLGQVLGKSDALEKLKDQLSVSYDAAYQKLKASADKALNRPLKNGFRMEGYLDSAALDKVQLLADGMSIGIRAKGELRLLYGL
jgi:hypothetical protein